MKIENKDMSKQKAREHEESYVDFDQPYEQNIIGMRGIIYFAIGLILLIVITFGLMWVFQYQVLQPDYNEANERDQNPMEFSKDEKLPPEPRLQSAPGFGVDDPRNGQRINLELREPQAEYHQLTKIWQDQWENGQKDEKTGTVISLPIDEAKEKFLEGSKNINTTTGETGEKALNEARTMISASSAGRMASNVRR